jgi:hypothetical protein
MASRGQMAGRIDAQGFSLYATQAARKHGAVGFFSQQREAASQ